MTPSLRDQGRLAKMAAALQLECPRTRLELQRQIEQLYEGIRAAQSLDDLGMEANSKAMLDHDQLWEMVRQREALAPDTLPVGAP